MSARVAIRLSGPELQLTPGLAHEWLETDGLGGYAMGTVAGPSTRRYHSLLCTATRPPVGRMVLANRLEEVVVVDGVAHALQSNLYPGGVVSPDGYLALVQFRLDPWPVWTYRVGGLLIERALFQPQQRAATVISWRLVEEEPGSERRVRLYVRPLISGRDHHALHHENSALNPAADVAEGRVGFAPYPGVPKLWMHHNGVYSHQPCWYRHFQYPIEAERGLDHDEDLFSPGEVAFDLSSPSDPSSGRRAHLVLTTDAQMPDVAGWTTSERARRDALAGAKDDDPVLRCLRSAGAQLIVRRDPHRTVIAGYPWFTDWGRDTFISLAGLSLIPGQTSLVGELLAAFARYLDGGLLPNRFPDEPLGAAPEYNTVDAPLWFVLAYARFVGQGGDGRALLPAARSIIDHYLDGTGLGIGVDDDGLIHAEAPGLQLTWMDAKVGDWVVTPRRGKPVEIQALWVAALEALGRVLEREDAAYAHELFERAAWARSSFESLFWDDSRGYLYDVVDGTRKDSTLRPNQLFALGLCKPLIAPDRAVRALEACEAALLTPVGLRSRAPGPGFIGRYEGDQRARDAAYHEGTVWPYLIGIFADACQRVRGHVPAGLLDGLRAHVLSAGLGNVAEIFDGDAPHRPRGCPAQAWSVGELLRVSSGEVGRDF